MARAEAAGASARSDSIKGLAQSIAKPAYRRLLTAEPALRRAVPALIVAFLITIAIGAFVQVIDHRRTALSDAANDIDTIAEVLSERLDRPRRDDTKDHANELAQGAGRAQPGDDAAHHGGGASNPGQQCRRHGDRGRPFDRRAGRTPPSRNHRRHASARHSRRKRRRPRNHARRRHAGARDGAQPESRRTGN